MHRKRIKQGERESLLSNSLSYGAYLRSSSYSDYSYTDSNLDEGVEEIKKKLQWYFKNPYEKYKDRGRKPFKLILQIFKIIMVTVQATIFAVDEFSVVQFNMDNIETFRNLFLVDYKGENFHELYTREQVYNHMYYTWKQYYDFNHIMIGSYELKIKNQTQYPPIQICTRTNSKIRISIDPVRNVSKSDNSGYYVVGSFGEEHTKVDCFYLKPFEYKNKTSGFAPDVHTFVRENNITTNFEWVLEVQLIFSFTINNSMVHKKNSPDCYKFDIQVVFDNSDLDGIMTVRLDSTVDFHMCRQKFQRLHIQELQKPKVLWTFFDICIITVCVISLTLCLRSMRRHYRLAKDTSKFFREYRHEKFTLSDHMNFVSFWLLLIALSDICSLAGSIIKILLDWMELPELYDSCSLFFGLAVLFSWIGILRYLGFMEGYNTLLVTLKTAFPTIIRFIFCVALIYIGFTVCGWIVFGPYHPKFRNLYITSESLFSLINGDDMFAAFGGMDDSDPLIWYFSKVYLYTFISLFIFVVLSLFIGIVANTYERLRDYGHPPKTRVELFMDGKEYCEEGEQQHRHGGDSQRPSIDIDVEDDNIDSSVGSDN